MKHIANLSLGVFMCGALVWALPAMALPTNLAPAGTAAASSIYSAGYEAINANDISRVGDTIWHSANVVVDPLWFEVDLGVDKYLDRVQIFPRNATQGLVKNFKIDVFNSANTNVFSQSFLPSRSTGDKPWATSALRGVQGSRVRITREPRFLEGYDDAMTFAEFEVWGQDDPLQPNIAINRPVTASGPQYNGLNGLITTANLANDGNLSGSFYLQSLYKSDSTGGAPFNGPYGNGHFWQVELAALTPIDYVNVFAQSDDPTQNGPIRISVVAANGTTIVDSIDTNLDGNDFGAARYNLTEDFVSNPIGKYLRIEMLDTTKVLALGEVEVFAAPVVVGTGSVAVPEPSAITMAILAIVFGAVTRHRRS